MPDYPHIHICECGRRWPCCDPCCEPECRPCQDDQMGDWLFAREMQLPLPDMPPMAVEEF